MPSNRQYAGPHDVAELMIDDGVYVAVLRNDIDDDTALGLGYVFDDDDAVRLSRLKVVRTITVSDELGLKLDRAFIEIIDEATGKPTDELVSMWPNVGGATGQAVDSPATNPATVPVKLDDDTELTSAEVDERAYEAAAALEVEERLEAENPVDPDTAAADRERQLRDRLAGINARAVELDTAHMTAVEAEDEAAVTAIEAEAENLANEKADIEKALDAGKGQ